MSIHWTPGGFKAQNKSITGSKDWSHVVTKQPADDNGPYAVSIEKHVYERGVLVRAIESFAGPLDGTLKRAMVNGLTILGELDLGIGEAQSVEVMKNELEAGNFDRGEMREAFADLDAVVKETGDSKEIADFEMVRRKLEGGALITDSLESVKREINTDQNTFDAQHAETDAQGNVIDKVTHTGTPTETPATSSAPKLRHN